MQTASASSNFDHFYTDVFLLEHRHPLNVALHVFGALVSAGFAIACLALPGFWKALVLLYPIVHVAPALLGHLLFERDAEVGDLRINRTDYPGIWFIRANYRMTWELLTGRLRR